MLKRLIWLGAVVILFLLGRSYLSDYAKLQDLRAKNKNLETRIAQLDKEIEHLKQEEQRLLTDPEYVERRARSKLKMSKEGEIVYKIPSE